MLSRQGSNPRQVWDLVSVSVTSLTAQKTGGQPKQKLHFCPSTRENLLVGTGEGAGLRSGRVAGVLVETGPLLHVDMTQY